MSTPDSSPVVAVVNPLWMGHHPTWFAQITASFLKAGAHVIGLCAEPALATQQALAEAEMRGIPPCEERISMHYLPLGKRSWFGGRFEGDPWRTRDRWYHAAVALEEAETVKGWKADLVYFPYLDSYLRFLPSSEVPGETIGRPWSGLYLRNHHYAKQGAPLQGLRLWAKGDALMRSPLCRGIGVLDERFNADLARYTGQKIISYPDSAPFNLPDEPVPLAKQIVEEANGRKIVGLIGLEKRKGMLNLLRVALRADRLELPLYFVCAGVYGKGLFTKSEQQFIEGVADTLRGRNLHFNPAASRIPDEAAYNSIFTTFDVAWIAYEGFQGSSGALTKAAGFGIPTLATAGECIGARVERHSIGLTIPEGDSDKALDAIKRLIEGMDWKGEVLNPQYEEYRELHKLERLDAILAGLVAKI
jgi:glycosyltransferase involved in cell wall biosynthesis